MNRVILTFDFNSEYGNFTNAAPTAVFIVPDGSKAFVVNSAHDAVGVINTRESKVTKEIPLLDAAREAICASGALAGALSPDGRRLYVSNLLRGTVSVIGTVNESRLGEIGLLKPASSCRPRSARFR